MLNEACIKKCSLKWLIYGKIKLHTESVEVGAPLFHPNLLGQLTPDEVLQNKPTGSNVM